MVLPNYVRKASQIIGLIAFSSLFVMPNVYAQGGSPLPGAGGQYRTSAPAPGAPVFNAPGPFPGAGGSGYDRLPLNAGNAQSRLEELRAAMTATRPKDFQDSISGYSDWLSDMADAHWKLSQSFAKHDSTKAYAESERLLCLRFGQLKRQAMLLKAEFLISQRRYPEALSPLVDIAAAEPKTETGQRAYRLLQEIGFSDAVPATSKVGPASTRSQIPLAKTATSPH